MAYDEVACVLRFMYGVDE